MSATSFSSMSQLVAPRSSGNISNQRQEGVAKIDLKNSDCQVVGGLRLISLQSSSALKSREEHEFEIYI